MSTKDREVMISGFWIITCYLKKMKTNLISPAYVAFYHLPIVWISKEPTVVEWDNKSNNSLFSIVLEGEIESNIRYRVRRDGLIMFDCNKWEPGTYTTMPQFDLNPGDIVPQETINSENLAEQRAYNRAMLVNAYQCCLHSAHTHVRNRSHQLGHPVESRQLINLTSFDNPGTILYFQNSDPYCEYINRVINDVIHRRKYAYEKRQLVEDDVIEYSFNLLNSIIESDYADTIKLVELMFWSQDYYKNSSFSNSLIHSWTICEKLLNYLWGKHLKELRETPEGKNRINSKRMQKLTGRDFTASIVSESLELFGHLPHSLFVRLDKIRKDRNNWLHSLESINASQANEALKVARDLLYLSTNIKLHSGLSRVAPGTGGVPLKYYKMPE